MTKVGFAAWLLVLGCWVAPPALSKDPTQLLIKKGAHVGVVNLMDSEVAHFHTAKVLAQSFFKTQPMHWQVDAMLAEAVSPRLTQLELVPVPTAPSDMLLRNRDEYFVDNSVVKGLPREPSRELAQLAAANHLDALILLIPGLNNSSQAGGQVRRGLPDYLRGWGFVTSDQGGKPSLFNMTQVLLVSVTPKGVLLNAREWGGGYADDWADFVPPENPKQIPPEQLDQLQPLFTKLLTKQAGRVLDWITVSP